MQRRFMVAAIAATCWVAMTSAAVAQDVQVSASLSTSTVRTAESSLADVIADALRAARSADVAFVPAASFESVKLAPGPAHVADITGALTFHDEAVIVVKLSGKQVLQALEHSLALYPQRNSAFLQVSGITVNVNSAAAAGKHVTSVTVGTAALDPAHTYKIAMPATLAHGGLNYQSVWAQSAVDTAKGDPISMDDAVKSYLKKTPDIGAQGDKRIVFSK